MLLRRARRVEANLLSATGMLGASLTEADQGRPYLTGQLWSRTEGKPAVRNLRGDDGKEQPTRPQSSGVQVPAPPIACLRAVSISDARGGNEPRSART